MISPTLTGSTPNKHGILCIADARFVLLVNAFDKVEQAALYYGDQGLNKVEADLLQKAQELFQKANEYSIRWNVR